MADKTAIEWTDATWNPITGCAIESPGCISCYAMRLAGTRLKHIPSRADLTKDTKAGPVWTGEVRFNEEWLDQPLRWRRPRKIFVCAHGDLFAPGVPDEWIDKVFAVMALAPQHVFQVLTKRPARMREYLNRRGRGSWIIEWSRAINAIGGIAVEAADRPGRDTPGFPLPNVWLGVSAEDQKRADERIPHLLATPAAIRWISAEPLIGPIDFRWALSRNPIEIAGGFLSRGKFAPGLERLRPLDWIVAGGESGASARPMHSDWARSIRDQCQAAGVPFLFKQWGKYLPVGQTLPGHGKVHGATAVKPGRMKLHYGGTPEQAPKHAFAERGVEFASTADGHLTFRLGKARAGRLLDGVEHSEFPV